MKDWRQGIHKVTSVLCSISADCHFRFLFCLVCSCQSKLIFSHFVHRLINNFNSFEFWNLKFLAVIYSYIDNVHYFYYFLTIRYFKWNFIGYLSMYIVVLKNVGNCFINIIKSFRRIAAAKHLKLIFFSFEVIFLNLGKINIEISLLSFQLCCFIILLSHF